MASATYACCTNPQSGRKIKLFKKQKHILPLAVLDTFDFIKKIKTDVDDLLDIGVSSTLEGLEY